MRRICIVHFAFSLHRACGTREKTSRVVQRALFFFLREYMAAAAAAATATAPCSAAPDIMHAGLLSSSDKGIDRLSGKLLGSASGSCEQDGPRLQTLFGSWLTAGEAAVAAAAAAAPSKKKKNTSAWLGQGSRYSG